MPQATDWAVVLVHTVLCESAQEVGSFFLLFGSVVGKAVVNEGSRSRVNREHIRCSQHKFKEEDASGPHVVAVR